MKPPTVLDRCNRRVVCGGGWYLLVGLCQPKPRDFAPDVRNQFAGFRTFLVLNLNPRA